METDSMIESNLLLAAQRETQGRPSDMIAVECGGCAPPVFVSKADNGRGRKTMATKIPAQVKRYCIHYDARGEYEHPKGDFVHWPDYLDLSTSLAALEAYNERLRADVLAWQTAPHLSACEAHSGQLEEVEAQLSAVKERLAEALRFIDRAGGTALGLAMSGSKHPNWDGLLLDLSKEAMALTSAAYNFLKED